MFTLPSLRISSYSSTASSTSLAERKGFAISFLVIGFGCDYPCLVFNERVRIVLYYSDVKVSKTMTECQ